MSNATLRPAVQPGQAWPPRVDIVVVHYETPELLRACLRSIADCAAAVVIGNFLARCVVGEVVVVDNSVSATSIALAREASSDVRLLRPGSNVGYGAAVNSGVATTTAEYVLVLNADTVLTPGCAAALVDDLHRHPEAAIVGPRLVDPLGRTQPSCAEFPTVAKVALHESGLWKLLGGSRLERRVRPFFDTAEASTVPWVLGAALAIRRAPFEAVGGFAPSFFMYYEEVDLCRRLATAGSTTRYSPSAVVCHVGGASSAAAPLAAQRPMYRSLATYLRRHGPDAGLVALRLVVIAIAGARLLRDVSTALVARRGGAARLALRTWTSIIDDAAQGWSR